MIDHENGFLQRMPILLLQIFLQYDNLNYSVNQEITLHMDLIILPTLNSPTLNSPTLISPTLNSPAFISPTKQVFVSFHLLS